MSAASPTRTREVAAGLLTVTEAAEYLNVTPRWIKRAYLDGRLASVTLSKHPRAQVRIPKETLDNFIAANTRQAR